MGSSTTHRTTNDASTVRSPNASRSCPNAQHISNWGGGLASEVYMTRTVKISGVAPPLGQRIK